MGLNGSIELSAFFSLPSNANTKLVYLAVASSNIGQMNVGNQTGGGGLISFSNQGAVNSQVSTKGGGGAGGDFTSGGGTIITVSAIDTTANQNVGAAVGIAVVTDWIILERYSVKLYPTSP
jgi:hypothetical protein